ncbi:MAG: PTS sugar transporter subunit IIB [Erysipelotrichaceae bacterium]|nr:PTS sugar transporter subunit IIB [Erysipelotrichaceae bacterium]
MRILLACALGCTTGMMVENMKKVSAPDDVIEAHSVNEVNKYYKDYDCVLLGPQVRLELNKIREMCAVDNVPVDVIDARAYGKMDGSAVYEQAKKMINEGVE